MPVKALRKQPCRGYQVLNMYCCKCVLMLKVLSKVVLWTSLFHSRIKVRTISALGFYATCPSWYSRVMEVGKGHSRVLTPAFHQPPPCQTIMLRATSSGWWLGGDSTPSLGSLFLVYCLCWDVEYISGRYWGKPHLLLHFLVGFVKNLWPSKCQT